ncbi:MAG: hypothetical protein JWO92_980 [Chitinophagaceae bacterium]|nr:hypothetical protein [Chitinophagaceae bacterium]MDB5222743.1 hypothetical protein [Chitinophagaceae bacterium]
MPLIITGSVSYIINKGLRRSPVDFYGKINYLLDTNTHINILLAGSSRILTNIDPDIIDSITHLNSYNAGLNAATIKTCYNLISTTLNNQPNLSYVILNIDYNMFKPQIDPYKDAYYYPYESAENIFVYTNNGSANTMHKAKFLDVTAYDDYVKYAAIRGLLSRFKNSEKGFFPHIQPGFSIPDSGTLVSAVENYNEDGYYLLKKLMKLCAEKHIKLMLVIAPYQKKYSPALFVKNYKTILEYVKILAIKYSASYFDYTNIALVTDTGYFYNSWHLNIKGARAYSIQVANDLKQYVMQKSTR